jgi:hypothetical protein
MVLDKFRFIVGKPGEGYSTPWFVAASKNEIYLGSKNISGTIKISFHKSGACHLAIHQPHWEKMQREGVAGPSERFILDWSRAATPTSGIATAAVLYFPTGFLKGCPVQAEKNKPMFELESAPTGQAAEIRLLYTRESPDILGPKLEVKSVPLCHFDFPDGEHLGIVGRYVDLDAAVVSAFPKEAANFSELVKDSLPKPGEALEGLTMSLWNDPVKDGFLKLMEVGGIRLSAKSS